MFPVLPRSFCHVHSPDWHYCTMIVVTIRLQLTGYAIRPGDRTPSSPAVTFTLRPKRSSPWRVHSVHRGHAVGRMERIIITSLPEKLALVDADYNSPIWWGWHTPSPPYDPHLSALMLLTKVLHSNDWESLTRRTKFSGSLCALEYS